MTRDGAIFGALIVLLLAVFGIGYAVATIHAAKRVATAQADTSTCVETAKVQQEALHLVQTRLADEKAKAEAAQTRATVALQARDAVIAEIERRGNTAATGIRKLANEDADSAVLARLPVPAALAWRLWPAAAASAGAPANH